jgi:anti-sigma regulatory factor (Ser/Thr protein kinase)
MNKEFRREISALDEVFEFIDGFVAAQEIDESVAFGTRLAAEELFTNLVRHNSGGRDHIVISLERKVDDLILRLEDFDVEEFDGTQAEEVDVSKPLSERRPGGLGIHLVKTVMDELKYEYRNRTLSVTAVKNLRRKDV